MKAILVMDMPENCMVCPLCSGSDECAMQDEDANLAADTVSELMDGCPLVPMPERKQNACSHGFAGGWNACLDAVEETGSIPSNRHR